MRGAGAVRAWRGLGRTSASATSDAPTSCTGRSRTLADAMQETGKDAVDTICDLLLREDLGVSQVTSGPWSQVPPAIRQTPGRHGWHGFHVPRREAQPRTYGSYPRLVFGQFVRDEQLLAWSWRSTR